MISNSTRSTNQILAKRGIPNRLHITHIFIQLLFLTKHSSPQKVVPPKNVFARINGVPPKSSPSYYNLLGVLYLELFFKWIFFGTPFLESIFWGLFFWGLNFFLVTSFLGDYFLGFNIFWGTTFWGDYLFFWLKFNLGDYFFEGLLFWRAFKKK